MSVNFFIFAAALALAPVDRFSLADRLFNKGEYTLAASEYAALEGEKSIAADALLYRRAECDRALGQAVTARKRFEALLADHPLSIYADTARLRLALMETGAARVQALKVLDSDRVASAIRAEALYHLGEATHDPEVFARCVRVEPNGPYHAYAMMQRGFLLSKSEQPEMRRVAVSLFLEVAFSDAKLGEVALYQAAACCFADKRYGEAASLAKRYVKTHATGAHATDIVDMSAWCAYLTGNYADALVFCGAGKTDGTAYVRAASAQMMGDASKAKELFSQYLANYPQGRYRKESELACAHIDYAAAQATGDVAGMTAAAQRGMALSDSSSERLRLAWSYESRGDTEQAVREYQCVAEAYPGTTDAAQAMFQKAMIDLRAERWAAAELALAEVLAHSDKLDTRHCALAHYWRGMAACRLGHATEGASSLKVALATGLTLDEGREARLMLADIDFNAGRTNEAVVAYAQLVREGATVRMSAAKMLAVGGVLPTAEKKICAEALTKSEAATWRQAGYALLAEAERALGNLSAERAALEKCAAEPCETESLAHVSVRLGKLRSEQGDAVGAEAMLKKAVSLNAKNNEARAEAYLALATNASTNGDREAAKGYATVVVTLFEQTRHAADAAELLRTLEEK